jgi:hypothetical protein
LKTYLLDTVFEIARQKNNYVSTDYCNTYGEIEPGWSQERISTEETIIPLATEGCRTHLARMLVAWMMHATAEDLPSTPAGAGGAGVGGGGGRGRPANGQGRPGASEELYGNPNMKKITAFSFAPPGKNIPTRPAAAQGTACKILMKSCYYLCDIACV